MPNVRPCKFSRPCTSQKLAKNQANAMQGIFCKAELNEVEYNEVGLKKSIDLGVSHIYAMRHNDARGWKGAGVIGNDVLKMKKVIEFQS